MPNSRSTRYGPRRNADVGAHEPLDRRWRNPLVPLEPPNDHGVPLHIRDDRIISARGYRWEAADRDRCLVANGFHAIERDRARGLDGATKIRASSAGRREDDD